MRFSEIAQRFVDADSGTDAFKAFYQAAFDLMKTDAAHASLYFVVGVAARSFVQSYEDQAITREFVDRAKATLVGFNQKIVQALNADPAQCLQLLNQVALDYEWNVHDF